MKLFERDGKFSKAATFLSIGYFTLLPTYLLTNLFQGGHVTLWGMVDYTVKAMPGSEFALVFGTLTALYLTNDNQRLGT